MAVAMLMAVSACQSGIETAAVSESVPIRIIYRDSQCLNDAAKITPIRDAATLANWWQPLAKQQFPAKPLPQKLTAIDFSQSAVFIVFMGSRPTAGYGIELHDDSAHALNDSLTIPAFWKEPAAGMMVAQVMTSPCVVITVQGGSYESVAVRDRHGDLLLETHF